MSSNGLETATGKCQRWATCWCLGLILSASGNVLAQRNVHALYNTRMPAGEIGRLQVAHRPDLQGVWQPVLLRLPESASVALAVGGGFSAEYAGGALVSMQVGSTYRLRVSNIPFEFGEVYPTVELIDRLHPPAGKETRFPIPIEITTQDLRMAIAGKYVTRVIYVEDPRRALPVRDLPQQRYVDALAHEDPLAVADEVGRPVAILRLGSVAPAVGGPNDAFLFGSPAFLQHPMPPAVEYVPSEHSVEAERRPPEQPAPPNVPQEEPAAEQQAKPDAIGAAGEENPTGETEQDAKPSGDAAEEVNDPFEQPATDETDSDIFDDSEIPPEDDNPFC